MSKAEGEATEVMARRDRFGQWNVTFRVALFALFFGLLLHGLLIGNVFENYQNATSSWMDDE
jgi:uncharacterized membrane protein YjjP (DUF1212 family)